MTQRKGQQVSEHGADFDDEEIFPAASEAPDEAAAGNLTDTAAVTDSAARAAAGRAEAVSGNDSLVAAERLAEGSTSNQEAADTDSAPTAGVAAGSESANVQRETEQSVNDVIEQAAASVAGQDTIEVPMAALLGHDISTRQAGSQASAQQGSWDKPDGCSAQEQCGREYPWMQPSDHVAVSDDQVEQTGDPTVQQQPHVSFATVAMARRQGTSIPMRYLAAAAADKQEAAEEAAEEAAAAAAAAAVDAADRRRQRQTAAAAAMAGTAAETAVQSQDVLVSQANTDRVAEQGWPQGKPPAENSQSKARLSFPDSCSPCIQPTTSMLAGLKGSGDCSQGHENMVQAEDTAGVHRSSLEGSEQADAVSVASFANSAASGLGHLMRAQQPWSESSSSPDRSSMTGSADARDISQLQAQVIGQHDAELQLPQGLKLPGQEPEQPGGMDDQPESCQGQQQLPSAQEQLHFAQHPWDKGQTEPQKEDEHDWQQENREALITAEWQQENMPGLQTPFDAASANARSICEVHAAGKQFASTSYCPATRYAI